MRKILLAGALSLGACATITEGTTQRFTVDVVPASGTCVVKRSGETLGASIPGARTITIQKGGQDLTIDCSAPGHEPRTQSLSSNLSGATVVSFLFLDFGLVDAATGAWKKYPEHISVTLQPLPAPAGRRR